jgi:carboxymethylenebutenolidase
MSSYISLSVPGASAMQCYVTKPAQLGRRPGIVLFQEAYGVNAHIRDVAERFSREGYVTYAPELFHRSAPAGFEGNYGDFQGVMQHINALTIENTAADIRATHAAISADDAVDPERIGAIGFCMGGRAAFLANLTIPVRASVSFYGGGIAEELSPRASELHGAAMLLWGGLDQRILPEHIRKVVDALRAADRHYVNAEFSGAQHGFFNDAGPRYHKESAEIAWQMVKQFFAQHLGA